MWALLWWIDKGFFQELKIQFTPKLELFKYLLTLLSFSQKKENHTGLEKHEVEVNMMNVFSILGELSL